MSFLEIKGIHKKFEKQTALNDIHVNIDKGELVCILGPSGCGKTTLLRIIAGLESSDSGSIILEGSDCTMLPPSKRNFGIVFQSYALFPNMTVSQNILFGLRQQKKLNKKQQSEKVNEVLEMVDLVEHRNKYPSQLSGGQQQRTALARAIALSPSFLLLDEPLSALDAKVRVKLRAEICSIQRKLGITTIMVTHDQEEALTMADKIVVMNNSVVEQIGTPKEIYDSPATPFVAGFIGTMNFYNTGEETIGIRPERVIVSETNVKNELCLPAVIRFMEFRGALTRIYGELLTKNTICADVLTEQVLSMGLSERKQIFFQLSQQHMIKYGKSAAVV